MIEIEHPAGEACRNCGHVLDGPYCSACGQAEHDGHRPTLQHFMHDLVHEFVHVDGTIFRTLKALFFQPGKLTEEYWAGHIVAWIRPIRLFLVIAAIHLLLSTGVGPMNFHVDLTRKANGEFSYGVYNGPTSIVKHGGTPIPEEQRREFFEKFGKTYDSIRYSSVLVFALACWLLYRRKQPYFVSHLIAGVHFYSFWYSLAIVASLLARWQPFFDGLSVWSIVYLFFVLRRLFPEHWLLRVVKTIVLFAILMITELALGLAAAWWIASRLHA